MTENGSTGAGTPELGDLGVRLLAKSPVMLPIPGTSSIEHLEENVAAADLHLTDTDLATLRT